MLAVDMIHHDLMRLVVLLHLHYILADIRRRALAAFAALVYLVLVELLLWASMYDRTCAYKSDKTVGSSQKYKASMYVLP